jgi:acyl-CoA synthetase (NDP forming)
MDDLSSHVLHKFFHPESVALVGASNNELRINYHLVNNQLNLGYKGRLYPVNPKEKEIRGLKAYPNVSSIPEIVDLAVIAVSNMQTPAILAECLARGIRRLALVAGGFSEIGPEGKAVQQQMKELVRSHGARAIGPNALSPINPRIGFAISFHPLERIPVGGLSLIFQSGLYEPRLRWLFTEFNLHLNKLIDLGNKMDLNEVDALSYLVFDPGTRVIGLHMESIEGDPEHFLSLLRQASDLGKPVVILKTGRTEEGARAAASHTGAIARGSDAVFDRILAQHGAIRAYTIAEFFDVARALERFGALRFPGRRVVVATLPGGEAVMMTDLVQQEGMLMAQADGRTLEKLKPTFPPWEIAANPFDLGVALQFNDPVRVYGRLIEAMAEDEGVDALHIQIPDRILMLPRDVFALFHKAPAMGKPLVLWVAGVEPGTHATLSWLEEHQIPVFSSPEKALHALAVLHRFTAARRDG